LDAVVTRSFATRGAASTTWRDQRLNPLEDGHAFVTRAVRHPEFRRSGVIRGKTGTSAWALVDPLLHPLYVWKKEGISPCSYGRTAVSLRAAVFTNGPFVGKRLASGLKVTRGRAARAVAIPSGVVASWVYAASPRWRGLGAVAAGGAVAAATATRVFNHWIPCGYVVGERHGIYDFRDFDCEGRAHMWFGRLDFDFDSYHIGQGYPPRGVVEGVGGLLPLVRDYRLACFDTEFRSFLYKRGLAGWALIDLHRSPTCVGSSDSGSRGVLFVFGDRTLTAVDAAGLLVSLGARDAVATDQRASVLVGAESTFAIGPPSILRQAVQQYGLYCA
jgi:hypothetical protein